MFKETYSQPMFALGKFYMRRSLSREVLQCIICVLRFGDFQDRSLWEVVNCLGTVLALRYLDPSLYIR